MQGVLFACGLLAAFATAERLAAKQRVRPDRIATAALVGTVAMVVGERLLLLVHGWRDFLAHPLWMLGLLSVRDARMFYAGAALAILACLGYLLLTRTSILRALNALLPGIGLLLAFVHAGYWAVGAEPGRVTGARWGVVSMSRTARALYGTPLHLPLWPVAAWASVVYALLSLGVAVAATRGRSVAGAFLVVAGVTNVLLGQLQMQWSGEPLVLGVFSYPQTAGAMSAAAGALLLLRR